MSVIEMDKVSRAKRECGEVVDGFATPKLKHAKMGYDMACLVEAQQEKIAELRRKLAAHSFASAGKTQSGGSIFDSVFGSKL